jgi:hypothetical protein
MDQLRTLSKVCKCLRVCVRVVGGAEFLPHILTGDHMEIRKVTAVELFE